MVITDVAKARDPILAWLKFKKEQKNRVVPTFGRVDRLLKLYIHGIRFGWTIQGKCLAHSSFLFII
ncbi:hypothetical protein EL466_13560 [Enterococcus faecium]|nr:hypothetical protein [Enterococcus faecium]PQE57853.1 hypothetical protein CUS10_14310 [Enterococcus faecium]